MAYGARILVIDDESHIRRSLYINLERRGYAVEAAETGEEALASFSNRRPDVLIVDLVLPGINGVEVTKRIRQSSAVPIIVLSALGEERRKVEALEAGADDYMTKPFGMEELLARIRSLLRRAAGAQGPEPVFVCGRMRVNFDRREVLLDQQPVKLTPTEYDLLKYMIEHAGKVLTHRMLLEAIWRSLSPVKRVAKAPAHRSRTSCLTACARSTAATTTCFPVVRTGALRTRAFLASSPRHT